MEIIIADENLNRDETYRFIKNAFRDGNIPTTGTALTKVLRQCLVFRKLAKDPKNVKVSLINLPDSLKDFLIYQRNSDKW